MGRLDDRVAMGIVLVAGTPGLLTGAGTATGAGARG